MKMHNKQKFEIDNVPWEFRKGQMTQGSLHAVTKNGTSLAFIRPADWSQPIWAHNNAVLVTRGSQDNKWREHGADTIKNAVRKGTQHARNFSTDRQIGAMESAIKQAPKVSQSNDKNAERLPKFKNLHELMNWQQKQKVQGKDSTPPFAKENDQGMGM